MWTVRKTEGNFLTEPTHEEIIICKKYVQFLEMINYNCKKQQRIKMTLHPAQIYYTDFNEQ